MHDISIIGGGISGLSAGIALKQFPLKIKILERNESFSNLGAGIQLAPNATCSVSSLGLLDEVLEKSAHPNRLLVFDIALNQHLCCMELGSNIASKYGYPYLTILRSDLHSILENKLQGSKNIEIVRGFKISDLKILKNKISVFNNQGNRYDSHALIGSDGIHSIIQKSQFKNNSIGSNESTAFRTLIKNDCKSINKHSKDIKVWFGNTFHAVTYPVGLNNDINIVVVTKQIHYNSYGWSNPCELNDFFYLFAPYPNSEITKLIISSSEWFRWPIYKCKPIKKINEMTKSSIILLGDAAHYMKPHLAQGASMALEDSCQISYLLKKTKFVNKIDWNKVFEETAKKRIKRISKVQKRSIRNGYIFQCSGILRIFRNIILKCLGNFAVDQKWLFKRQS